ncbi:hypothetical protein ACFC0C_27145 [Streptomyces sp. NPDC056178]|uniref:hypothetical protein n=1 Tax=unclassified Streptomyces TaxID=2593676 RepID=UPI0035DFE87E
MGRHLTVAAPEPAGRVQAVGFDGDTGHLDIAPDAPAYGTKLRRIAPKLVATTNAKVSGANVRAPHVLAPAAVKAGPAAGAVGPSPPARPRPRNRSPPPASAAASYGAARRAATLTAAGAPHCRHSIGLRRQPQRPDLPRQAINRTHNDRPCMNVQPHTRILEQHRLLP